MNIHDECLEAAINLIEHYVKRGDGYKHIKGSMMGYSGPQMHTAMIGGWHPDKVYNSDHIVVQHYPSKEYHVFKYKTIYELIDNPVQQSLF